MSCKFPITRYEGEYMPEWTRQWKEHREQDSWLYFDTQRDIVLENHSARCRERTLAGDSDNWGAFTLLGVLQIDHLTIYKACGQVSVKRRDLELFFAAGKRIVRERSSRTPRQTGPTMKWVYCIPGKRNTKGHLTLVTINDTMNEPRVEVYFLRGQTNSGIRSQLPGMKEFYFWSKIEKVFTDFFFHGRC